MNLKDAASFHAIASAGGITAASAVVGKSPPALHADLRRFERAVGHRLTERVGRKLQLTPAGRRLFEVVDRSLAEIGAAAASLHHPGAVTPLRLGSVTGFGRYRLMPRLLATLGRERPVTLRSGSHDEMLALLHRAQIDFALTYRPVASSPIEARPVAREGLVLVGLPDGPDVSLERLQTLPCVRYVESDYVFARWFAGAHGRQPETLVGHDHFDELEEALMSVAAGRGFTIAPKDACEAFGLHAVGPVIENTIFLCGATGRLGSQDAEILVAAANAEHGSGIG